MTTSINPPFNANAVRSAEGLEVDCTNVQEATPRQVQDWLRSGEAVLIDVREPDEHVRERISGSTLMPLSGFDPKLAAAHAKPGQRLVLHCRGGQRSANAARMAASLSNSGGARLTVASMKGGIEAWKKAALPVEMNASVTGISIMRQVQLVIGAVVLGGSALAWFVHPGLVAIPAFFGAGLVFAGVTGTCALATLIGKLPWNSAAVGGGSCQKGRCG